MHLGLTHGFSNPQFCLLVCFRPLVVVVIVVYDFIAFEALNIEQTQKMIVIILILNKFEHQ